MHALYSREKFGSFAKFNFIQCRGKFTVFASFVLKALPLLKAFVKKMFAQFIKNLQIDLEVYNIISPITILSFIMILKCYDDQY